MGNSQLLSIINIILNIENKKDVNLMVFEKNKDILSFKEIIYYSSKYQGK